MYPVSAAQDIEALEASMKVEGANVATLQPFFHTPGNAQDSYQLPKSYVEQIRWSRLLYNLNAYIGAITDLKAYYAYSNFKLITAEPFVTEFYNQVAFNKRFNLYRFILRMSLSYHKFGEAIAWGSRKQDGYWPKTGQPKWVWDNFILLEPELVEIKKAVVGDPEPKYFLRPNKDLEDLVKKLDNNDPEVEYLHGQISEPVMEKIRKKDLVPLDNSTISSIQNLTDASATRGTPPYQRLFVTYIYEDFVRLAQIAQANRYHFPIELWTLGDLEKKILPQPGDLDKLRELVTNAIQQPPFAIFFPPILKYEALGVQGKLLSIKDDYDYIWKTYMVGMGVDENMILGSSGIFSSTETSGNQAFIRMRSKERDEMTEWMIWNFFEPLARWNNLKMVKGGILSPILPSIEWDKDLDYKAAEDDRKTDEAQYKAGLLPSEDWLSKSGKNPEEIKLKLEQEIGSVFDDGKRIAAPAIRAKLAAEGKLGPKEAGAGGPGGAGGPEEAAPETAGGTPEAPGTPIPEAGEAPAPEIAPGAEAGAETAPPAAPEAGGGSEGIL
jgi:hypothetical protein